MCIWYDIPISNYPLSFVFYSNSDCPITFTQDHVGKEDLLNALQCEFINRVNEVGVDVNRAMAHPYTQSLVQYICGLGPRKGAHLLKVRQAFSALAFILRLICVFLQVFWVKCEFIPLKSNNKCTIHWLVSDPEAEQHSSGKQDPASHHVSHGTEGLHQLCRFYQDRHRLAWRQVCDCVNSCVIITVYLYPVCIRADPS